MREPLAGVVEVVRPKGGAPGTDERLDLSLVIPIYNERGNLGLLVAQIQSALEPTRLSWEVIGVDDGGNDGSAGELTRLAETEPRLRLIQLSRRFGQTAAISAGIAACRGEFVALLDADLQNDPADIPSMVDRLRAGFDVVSGWRINRQDRWLTRKLPSELANVFISWVSGVKLHDYGCTLKLYRREWLKDLRLFGEMHRLIPLYLAWQGARIIEVPVKHRTRAAGRSKYGLSRLPRVLLDLLVVMFLIRYSDRPMRIFGGFGLFSMGVAGLTASWAIYRKIAEGVSFILTPLPLLTVFFFLVGVLAILMGLLAEIMIRTYYHAAPASFYRVKESSE